MTFKDLTEAGDILRYNQSNNSMCYNDISKSRILGTQGSGRQIKGVLMLEVLSLKRLKWS